MLNDRRSRFLLLALASLILLSMGVSYYRYVVTQDFDIFVEYSEDGELLNLGEE